MMSEDPAHHLDSNSGVTELDGGEQRASERIDEGKRHNMGSLDAARRNTDLLENWGTLALASRLW